jgi:hypothetical protein
VHRRHHRPPVSGLDADALRVLRDVQGSARETEHQQRRHQLRQVPGETGRHCQQAVADSGDPRDQPAADAVDEPLGQRRAEDETDRDGEERRPERRVGQPRLRLDRRNPRHPDARGHPHDKEVRGRALPRPARHGRHPRCARFTHAPTIAANPRGPVAPAARALGANVTLKPGQKRT